MELAATRRYLGRLTFDGDRGVLVDEKLHFPTGHALHQTGLTYLRRGR